MRPSIFKLCALAGVALLAAYHSGSSEAASKWNVNAGAAASLSVTDNVCLEKDGDKIGWITTFTPSVGVSATTRKSSFSLQGSIRANSLTNSALRSEGCQGRYDDRDQYDPRLIATYARTIVPKLLKLNLTARIGQNEVSSRFRSPDEFNRTGNENTYFRWSISPTLTRKIAGKVNTTLRYTYDEVYNDNDLVNDSQSHAFNLNMKLSGPSQWKPSVGARHRIVQYDEDFLGRQRPDQEYGSAFFGLGYVFSNRFSVNGRYGYEWTNFENRFTDDYDDGNAWTASATYKPSNRTSITAGTGNRFYGKTPNVTVLHRHKRNTFTLRYNTELRFRRDIRTGDVGGLPGGLPNTGNPSIFTQDPIIDERVTFGWVRAGGRSSMSVTGNYSEQRRREDGDKAVYSNVNFTVAPRVSSVYTTSGTISWYKDEPQDTILGGLLPIEGVNDTETWQLSLRLSRTFQRSITGALVYQFSDRQVTGGRGGFTEYQENRITATVNYRF